MWDKKLEDKYPAALDRAKKLAENALNILFGKLGVLLSDMQKLLN